MIRFMGPLFTLLGLVGATLTALDKAYLLFTGCVALLLVGQLFLKIASKREVEEAGTETDETLVELLEAAVVWTTAAQHNISSEADVDIDEGQLIYEKFGDMIPDRIEAELGSLSKAMDVVGPFSQAQRAVNRAWSAKVDEFPIEMFTSLEEALKNIEDAQTQLQRHMG